MNSKKCPQCLQIKPAEDFYRNKSAKDGLNSYCKKCSKSLCSEWNKRNPEPARARTRKWIIDNDSRYRDAAKKYRDNNRERLAKKKLEWASNHRDIGAAQVAQRHAAKLPATPIWANKFFISEAYRLAAMRSKLFGFKWHVDHIVPLQSKFVCGLHVEYNLQVIAGPDNLKKSNKWWPNMAGSYEI